MTSNGVPVDRRTVLECIATGCVALGSVGVASGESGAWLDRYIVLASDDVADRLEGEGATVRHELADGEIYIVDYDGDRNALVSTPGVDDAVRDTRFGTGRRVDEPLSRVTGVAGTSDDEETLNEEGGAPTDFSTDESLVENQWDKRHLRAEEAHDLATGEGATIAVVDSGIDHTHPDLEPNVDVDAGRAFVNGDVLSGTGEVEVMNLVDGINQGTKTVEQHVAADVWLHGTEVAGVAAAASRDGHGIVGVAPDATIVSCRVFRYFDRELDNGQVIPTISWTVADAFLAVDYAVEIGVDAINLSLERGIFDPPDRTNDMVAAFQRLFEYAVSEGSVVVVAADNHGQDYRDGIYTVPGSEQASITVSATGPNDDRAFYSNYGQNLVDVAAPGGGYETRTKTGCNPNGRFCRYDLDTFERICDDCEPAALPYPSNLVLTTAPPEITDYDYTYARGTSFSAPQVAGLVALCRELEPEASPNRIERAIYDGAVGASGRGHPDLGAGRIDLVNTLEQLS